MKQLSLSILCLLTLCASSSAPAKPASQRLLMANVVTYPVPAPADMKKLLPLALIVPADYVIQLSLDDPSGTAIHLLGQAGDVQKVLETKSYEGISNGVFTLGLSMEVGFSARTKKFSGEDDPKSVRDLERAGATAVRFSRMNPHGVPVLMLTEKFNNRQICLAYVALGTTGSVIKISYHSPSIFSSEDARTWEMFIRGLTK